MNPRVSVIIPTYNRAHVLETAIGSVLAQTDKDWELIVVDDGSTDGTKELVENIADPRIHYIAQDNAGPSAARNRGAEEAKGQWLAYLDSDNVFYPDYLAQMFAHIKEDTVFAFPKGRRILELYIDGVLKESIDKTEEEFAGSITPQGIFHRELHTDTNGLMYRRQCAIEGVYFDESMKGMEDWEILLTLSTKYPDGFLYVPEILYSYSQRFGGDGMVSGGGYRTWATLFEYVYQKHKDDPLMTGQKWYPERVHKWNELADKFDRGEIPPYYLWYFRDHWPAEYKNV